MGDRTEELTQNAAQTRRDGRYQEAFGSSCTQSTFVYVPAYFEFVAERKQTLTNIRSKIISNSTS